MLLHLRWGMENKIQLRVFAISFEYFSTFYAIAAYVLINTINKDRLEGIWNRCVVAGVKPEFVLISRLVEGSLILLAQIIVVATYLIFFMGTPISAKSAAMVVVLLVFVGFAGLTFGLLCSASFENPQAALYASQAMVYLLYFLSGEWSRVSTG